MTRLPGKGGPNGSSQRRNSPCAKRPALPDRKTERTDEIAGISRSAPADRHTTLDGREGQSHSRVVPSRANGPGRDQRTAHVDERGKPFWDDSFDVRSGKHKMCCPFALDFRKAPMREQVEFFARAYEKAGLDVGFIFVDWEIDGSDYLFIEAGGFSARNPVGWQSPLYVMKRQTK